MFSISLRTSAELFTGMLQKITIGGGERPTARNTDFDLPKSINPFQAFARPAAKRKIAKTPATRKSTSRGSRPSVLVVDDVPDVTEMIALFLKHAGYEVATAGSAPAALQLAKERAFDLIISDIGMPEMNGYELAESLRGRSEYQRTPMIAVTGYTEYDDRGRAQRAGFSAHLTKPIDPADLLTLMNELLS
jgi:CheY-like chemotaxis protein